MNSKSQSKNELIVCGSIMDTRHAFEDRSEKSDVQRFCRSDKTVYLKDGTRLIFVSQTAPPNRTDGISAKVTYHPTSLMHDWEIRKLSHEADERSDDGRKEKGQPKFEQKVFR